jgi:hypothetical protein
LLLLLVAGAQLWVLGLALMLYGASNGVMTIVRAVVPAELFDRQQYGATNGALSAPVIVSRAVAPVGASALWSASRGYAPMLWVLSILAALAVVCFWTAARQKPR